MTTTAKLAARLPDGNVLDDLSDDEFELLAEGETRPRRYAVVVLRPSGFAANTTSDGVKRSVKWTVDRLELVQDGAGQEAMKAAAAARGVDVAELPLEYGPDPLEEELRGLILEALLGHYEQSALDLNAEFKDFFDGTVTEPRKARLLHVRDFADSKGIAYQITPGGPLDDTRTDETASAADGSDEPALAGSE